MGKNSLDLLVRCLEQIPKNNLPNGGFDEWMIGDFSWYQSVKHHQQKTHPGN